MNLKLSSYGKILNVFDLPLFQSICAFGKSLFSHMKRRKSIRFMIAVFLMGFFWVIWVIWVSLSNPPELSTDTSISDENENYSYMNNYKTVMAEYLSKIKPSKPSQSSEKYEEFTIAELLQMKYETVDYTYLPLGLSSILSRFGPNEPIRPAVSEKEMNSRCHDYFQEASIDIDVIEYTKKELELLYLDKNTFVHTLDLEQRQRNKEAYKLAGLTEGEESDAFSLEDQETIDDWSQQWEELQVRFNQSLVDMNEGVANLRAFDSCYLKRKISDHDAHYRDLEKTYFKWATGEMPVVTDWKGVIVSETKSISRDRSFTKFLRDRLYKGEGLVVTLSNSTNHFLELTSLILSLRALKNTLPLQIIHFKEDLTPAKMNKIIRISRTTELKLHTDASEAEAELLPLDVYFVDVTPSIAQNYTSTFGTFGMKLVSLVFSTFKTVVLLDTDTVPFVDIKTSLLESKEFKELGAFFFRDRDLKDEISLEETSMMKALLPSLMDTHLLSTDRLTEKSYNHPLFSTGKKHCMESGMVLLDKKRHFSGVLAMLTLQLWDLISGVSYGDKELYWLGLTIMGDEQFFMSPLSAGAIGTIQHVQDPRINGLTAIRSEESDNGGIIRRICSTHPVHVSPWDSKEPLWMNSGFANCKRSLNKSQLQVDLSLPFFKEEYSSIGDLKKHYSSHLHITGMMIPPSQELYQGTSWPKEGWASGEEACDGLLYCAYEQVNGVEQSSTSNGGKVSAEVLVEFDQNRIDWFDSLGELWVSAKGLVVNGL